VEREGGRHLLALILLFTLEDADEGFVVELALLQGGLLPHLLDLLGGEVVSHVAQQVLQVLLGQVAFLLVVEHAEGLSDGVLRVGSAQLLAEEVEEHGEVDGSGGVLQHLVQLGIGGDTAQVGVHVLQVLNVDDAVTVLVDHGERLLHFLHGLLGDLGQDIAGATSLDLVRHFGCWFGLAVLVLMSGFPTEPG